ncbi:MAG: hypothetical protein RLZZ401_730, partial [Pseudomonadota bacterium]
MAELFIGLMSGTSLDGVDGVVVDFSTGRPCVVQDAVCMFAPEFRGELMALNTPGDNELHRAAHAANTLAAAYAGVVAELLARAQLPPNAVSAIGAHGQTVRHQPAQGYTLQLNNAALLAEMTGICVVSDFRSRDVAAGGQGAPLAPFFHQAMFSQADTPVAVLNIGGISNLTVLPAQSTGLTGPRGFDCGPGNVLMDYWCLRYQGQPYDDQGQWAAQGQVHAGLLASLLADPYFSMHPPKSTGRDLFSPAWLHRHCDEALPDPLAPVDVQATLCELSARSCAVEVARYAAGGSDLLVCGGGAYNTHLMGRLRDLLPAFKVQPSSNQGLPPLQVEAAAFAWLARKTLQRQALPLENTTGARGPRV